MAKLKYKKVNPQTVAQIADAKHRIEIISDGNIIELQSISGGVRTYKYIKSETKLGYLLTMNEKQFQELIITNQILKK